MNMAIGSYALAATTSHYNVGIGRSAGQYSTGYWNTFVGTLAGPYAGNSNTIIGGWAGGTSAVTGSSNVFIGYLAGKYHSLSDRLIIDNQDRTTEAGEKANALIYGKFNSTPAKQFLRINGDLNITGDTNIAGALAVGTNLDNNLWAGDINARFVYADAFATKSPILFKTSQPEPLCMMADNGIYVGCMPEFQAITKEYKWVCKPRAECNAKLEKIRKEEEAYWQWQKAKALCETETKTFASFSDFTLGDRSCSLDCEKAGMLEEKGTCIEKPIAEVTTYGEE